MHKFNQTIIVLTSVLAVSAALSIGMAAEEEEPAVFGAETKGCQFSAATDRPSYRFDEPIPLRLVLKNVGKEPVTINSTNPLMMYRFDVRGPSGKPVPLTLEGKHQSNLVFSGELVTVSLDPGRSDVGGIAMLNRYYDMTLLGEYTVTAYRKLVWQKGEQESFEVPSNTLKIVVRNYNAEETKARQQQESNEK